MTKKEETPEQRLIAAARSEDPTEQQHALTAILGTKDYTLIRLQKAGLSVVSPHPLTTAFSLLLMAAEMLGRNLGLALNWTQKQPDAKDIVVAQNTPKLLR